MPLTGILSRIMAALDLGRSGPVPPRTTSEDKTDTSHNAPEMSLDTLFDLSPVCALVLTPQLAVSRASAALRQAWGVDDCTGQSVTSVLAKNAALAGDDRKAIARALQAAIDLKEIQTITGSVVPPDSLAKDAAGPIENKVWDIRIVPVFRHDTLLSLMLEWSTRTIALPSLGLDLDTLGYGPAHNANDTMPPTPAATPLEQDRGSCSSPGPTPVADHFSLGRRPDDAPPQRPVPPDASLDESFRILVQTVKDYAIFLLDVDGHIVTWNAGAELNKGYTRDEILGRHFSVFYAPEDIAARKPQRVLADCLRNGRTEDEGWRIRKDGSRFWANVTITAVFRNGVHVGFGKVTRNNTERRAAELRVIAAYQESDKLKSEFLANMSHEIRTPMHGLLSACTLLLDTDLTDDQREITSIIDDSGQVLLRVINDILDYSKLASGSFSIHADVVGLRSLIPAVVRTAQATVKPDVQLEMSTASNLPSAVQGDPLRYRQILLNIIGNAVKFTDKGHINVACTVQAQDDTTFVILTKVTDTGIGVPPAAVGSLFVPFMQVDHTTKKRYQGLGLGLSICKSLVELMGGDIGYEPGPDGRGSVFWFTARFLKIKSLAQLGKTDDAASVDDIHTTPRRRSLAQISTAGLRTPAAPLPPTRELSQFEIERQQTIPPPLGRIAKSNGVSKAEVASGGIMYDLIEDDGLPPPTPPTDLLSGFFSASRTASRAGSGSISASGLSSQATTPSSDGTSLSPSQNPMELASPISAVVPLPQPPGESGDSAAQPTPESGVLASPTGSTFTATDQPTRKDTASTVNSAYNDEPKDLKARLKLEFERSIALLRVRAAGKRLLVAEDNPTNQRVLMRILREFAFEPDRVVLASHGAEALQKAKDARDAGSQFDLCLMDISMPVMDGHEATVHIRQQGIFMPIMAMTAYALQGDREQCLAYGMNDYIAKPVNKRVLVEKLLQWLPA